MRHTVRIAGKRWYDLGSDVDWVSHGGFWGRKMSPEDPEDTLWVAIRFDPAEDTRDGSYGCSCAIFELHPEDVSEFSLRGADVPADGCDEYGNPIDPHKLDMMRVAAGVWAGEGRVGTVEARTPGDGPARHVRACAARHALLDYISEDPRFPLRIS
jgi:hypothetical protein